MGPPPISTQPGPPAEFVRVFTDDRAMLHALLWRPANAETVAIYIPGFGGSFCCPNDLNTVAEMLMGRGFAFCAMNVRTVSPPGIMFARFEDCAEDIAAIVRFVQSRGLKHVVLIGDSLGAPRAVHYLQTKGADSIKSLIILGGIPSPYLEAQQRWDDADKRRYEQFLNTARSKIAAGAGQELLTFDDWFPGTPLTLSANTFLNLFGPPGECAAHVIDNADAVTIPTLVLHGSQDSTSVPANAEAIHNALRRTPRKELVFVDCEHFFFMEPHARAYGAEIVKWMASL